MLKVKRNKLKSYFSLEESVTVYINIYRRFHGETRGLSTRSRFFLSLSLARASEGGRGGSLQTEIRGGTKMAGRGRWTLDTRRKGQWRPKRSRSRRRGREGGGAIVGICMNRSRLFGREMSGGNGPTPNRRIIRNPCTGRNRVTVCHFRFCSLQRATMPAKRIIFVIPSLSSVLFSSPPPSPLH